jgi:uncharacterized membrane protein
MARTDDSTAFASNWRAVLAADAALGALVSVIGVVVAVFANVVVGVAMVAAGVAYAALVGVRARRWAGLRRSGPR